MRSCNSAAHCCRCASLMLPQTYTAMPRSMRSIWAKPQLWAMSVAFDAHGEMVPMRGVIRKKWLPAWVSATGSATRSASSKAASLAAASASKGCAAAAKYQYSLCRVNSPMPKARALCNSFSIRKSGRAALPHKDNTKDMIQRLARQDKIMRGLYVKSGLAAADFAVSGSLSC